MASPHYGTKRAWQKTYSPIVLLFAIMDCHRLMQRMRFYRFNTYFVFLPLEMGLRKIFLIYNLFMPKRHNPASSEELFR